MAVTQNSLESADILHDEDSKNQELMDLNRKAVVSGKILGDIESVPLDKWETRLDFPKNSERLFSLNFCVVPEDFVPGPDKEKNYASGHRVFVEGPFSMMEPLLKAQFKNIDQGKEGSDKISESVFNFPASKLNGDFHSYEFSKGENRWSECPAATSDRYSGTNIRSSDLGSKAKSSDVLIVIISNRERDDSAYVNMGSSSISSRGFKNVCVIGPSDERCDSVEKRISSLQDSNPNVTFKSFSYDRFKEMPKENQNRIIDHFSKNGVLLTGQKDLVLSGLKSLSQDRPKIRVDHQR